MARWYWDTRDTVEDARVLAVGDFHRCGYLRAGQGGTSRWRRGEQETGSIGWYCDGAALWLDYAVTPRDGEKRPYRYAVRLVRTPQPFGGERVWFTCPQFLRPVVKLYMAPMSHYFWCRACQGLSYRSRQERTHPYWRLWARAHELERALETTPRLAVAPHARRAGGGEPGATGRQPTHARRPRRADCAGDRAHHASATAPGPTV